MKQCTNCGAILPEGEQSVCFVCGTRQAAPDAFTPSQLADEVPYYDSTPPHSPAPTHHKGDNRAPRLEEAYPQGASPRTAQGQRTAPPSATSRPARAPEREPLQRNERARTGTQDATRGGKAPPSTKSRKPDTLLRMLGLVLTALLVLVLLGAGATYFMYDRFNAQDAYSALTSALLKADIPALRALVDGDDVAVTDAGLKALARAFSTQETVDRLLEQLKRQSAGAAGELPYPSLSPTSNPVFLGYKSYKLLAKPVSLQIASPAQNTLLSMDGTSVTGEPAEGGALYSGLFPGIYSCTVTGQTALGESILGAPTDVALFSLDTPTLFDGALPIANITISGCLSDDAILAVNGTDVEQKPVDKVVTLPQVSVGSTITLRYTTAYGASTTASVQFTDRTQTQLAFTAHATEGGVPPVDDLKALFGGFYASYADALNNADAARIVGCTEAMRSKLAGDTTKEENKAIVYLFKEAAVSDKIMEQGFLEDATPTLKCNASATYTTSKRVGENSKKGDDAKETSHTVSYAVELAYVDGGWKINRLAETTKENFEAGTLVPIEG